MSHQSSILHQLFPLNVQDLVKNIYRKVVALEETNTKLILKKSNLLN